MMSFSDGDSITASPAKAGVRPSADRTPEKWVPAAAGTATFFILTLSAFGVQAASLTAFVLVSRTAVAALAKPVVIAVATGSMASFVGYAAYSFKNNIRFVIMPLVFALEYLFAWHLLGAFWFPGLIKDLDWSSGDFWASIASVTGTLYVAYASLAIFVVLCWTTVEKLHHTDKPEGRSA